MVQLFARPISITWVLREVDYKNPVRVRVSVCVRVRVRVCVRVSV